MNQPPADICACRTPQRTDTRHPFRCMRCRRVMRLTDLMTVADVSWLLENHIELGPLEAR